MNLVWSLPGNFDIQGEGGDKILVSLISAYKTYTFCFRTHRLFVICGERMSDLFAHGITLPIRNLPSVCISRQPDKLKSVDVGSSAEVVLADSII